MLLLVAYKLKQFFGIKTWIFINLHEKTENILKNQKQNYNFNAR